MWLEFGDIKYVKIFYEENSSKQLFGTPSIKWKANIKSDLRKMDCEFSSCI
jgi:hypothetical protein